MNVIWRLFGNLENGQKAGIFPRNTKWTCHFVSVQFSPFEFIDTVKLAVVRLLIKSRIVHFDVVGKRKQL